LFKHLKSLMNFKDFLRSLSVELGHASNLVFEFDKQIANCEVQQFSDKDSICLNFHIYLLLKHQK